MPLVIQDKALDQAGNPLARYPVRAYYSAVSPFLLQSSDLTYRVGEAVQLGGTSVVTDGEGTFTLTAFAVDEMDVGGQDTEFNIIMPDLGHYHGPVPAGVPGPLTLYELWDQYLWTGPAGPGHSNPAPIDQMMGMLLL